MALKIFVADDSVTIHKIIGLAYSGQDVAIESATSGDAALEGIRAFRPDVILADVFMPGANGYEVCAAVKEDRQLQDVPVILLVGTFEPFDESEAARVKADTWLTKPFDTSELIERISRLVAGKPAQPQAEAPRGRVSPAARESFLGPNRVLDLFDAQAARAYEPMPAPRKPAADPARAAAACEGQISEEALERIVDRVVRRMSADVVREVAWEVVPELSEVIIRRSVEESSKK